MFVFLLAQLPLPIILFLNVRVIMKFIRIRRLSKPSAMGRPARLVAGWWLNNLAAVFFLAPSFMEQRLFVQDRRWLVFYATSAVLTISGLALINSALGQELRKLTSAKVSASK